MKISFCSVFIICLSLIGCTTVPVSFDVKNIPTAEQKIDGELKFVSVSFSGDEVIWSAELQSAITSNWKSALEKAFENSGIFSEDNSTKLNVEVKILKLDPGIMAYDVDTVAEYNIYELKSKKTLNKQVILSTGHASDFAGDVRMVKSLNDAVQNNIYQYFRVISK